MRNFKVFLSNLKKRALKDPPQTKTRRNAGLTPLHHFTTIYRIILQMFDMTALKHPPEICCDTSNPIIY